MTSEVPYLAKDAIEEAAATLLTEYGEEFEAITAPPVPVFDMIEMLFKATPRNVYGFYKRGIHWNDLRQLFGFEDVFGAIWINESHIAVDHRLNPHDFPLNPGRVRFAVGHEIGHWRLHLSHYLETTWEKALSDARETQPAFICRSSEREQRVEWQADFFSACLLMPRDLVSEAWNERRGTMEPITLDDLRKHEPQIIVPEMLEVMRRGPLAMDQEGINIALLEKYAEPLAEKFQVSREAMRVHLEELRLLVRK